MNGRSNSKTKKNLSLPKVSVITTNGILDLADLWFASSDHISTLYMHF